MTSSLNDLPQTTADHGQLLIQLLLGSGLVSRDELADFKNIARDLKLPLIQAMTSSGSLDKRCLQLTGEAVHKIQSKQISLDLAIRALRISVQQNVSFAEAVRSAQKLHRTTRIVLSATNDLTSLFLDADIITREQLGRLLARSHESAMMIGQVMISEGVVSVNGLIAALQATILIKENGLLRSNGIKALKHAYSNGFTIEQALFELDLFVAPDAKKLRMTELFLMSRLITPQDFVECLEIELFKNKEPGQILQERGLASSHVVESAMNLLAYLANDAITPNEAAIALNNVCSTDSTVHAAVMEIREHRTDEINTRLGDLVVDANVCSREQIEGALAKRPDSAIRVGNSLLKSGLMGEVVLFAALRLQTCLRLGYLSRDTAVLLLRYCATTKTTLDQTLQENNVFVPCRIQWLWV